MKNLFALLLVLLGFLLMPAISFAQTPLIIDPAIQQVVDDVLPAKYVSYANAILLASLIIGRWLKSIAAGRGIKGWFSSIWCGTNESTKILIATLCLLSLPACSNPDVERAALGTLAGAASGYATGGSQGAKLGAATGLANSLKPAAKQPVNVQP